MSVTILEVSFWASLLGIVYIFAGYPAAVVLLAKLWPTRAADTVESDTARPRLSVLIAAGNEAHRIEGKLDNVFACEAADSITEVVIGSDGSTDETVTVCERYPDERVRVVGFGQRRGKSAVLHDLIPTLTGDVVVFMDARQELDDGALSALAAKFFDPQIGVVSGELVFRGTDASSAAEGMGFYWTYEKLLRRSESRFRSVPGATGALYAVRRTHLVPPPSDAILDDVAIPMLAIEQGVRCVFEPRAVAYDTPSQSTSTESVRKRRTIAGVVQLIRQHPRWLVPRLLWAGGNPIWWEFMSHKVARLVAPVLLGLCLLSNAILATTSTLYTALLVLQVAFYIAAACGFLAQHHGVRTRLLAPPMMFVSLNMTTVFALADAARGRFTAAWQRTA